MANQLGSTHQSNLITSIKAVVLASVRPGLTWTNASLTLPSQNATTAFDKLFVAADSSAPIKNLAEKIGAVLSVLLAIRIAS